MNILSKIVWIGNGRNTVLRVLFRKRELNEFLGKLGEFCEKLGEFAFAHKSKAERNSLSSAPRTRWGPKNNKLTELSVWNCALRSRIRPVSEWNCLIVRVPNRYGAQSRRPDRATCDVFCLNLISGPLPSTLSTRQMFWKIETGAHKRGLRPKDSPVLFPIPPIF